MREKYTIVKEGNAAGHPVGTVCYTFSGYDYGLAREDTEATGKPWISMTLNEDGSAPSFTAPVDTLDPQPESSYVNYWQGKTVNEDSILLLETSRRDLAQSLRQWKMYAEEKEDYDLEYANDIESDIYRRCSNTLNLLEKEIDKRCGIVRQ